jgi:predicted aconitase with swiveling domain
VNSARSTAQGRALVRGVADAEALVLDEPLSFWGGVSAASGEIIDPRHPQAGRVLTARVLVMPSGRGSSSSSSVLAECLGAGTGPAAILLREADPILVLGAMVAAELGAPACPIVVLGDAYEQIRDGDWIQVAADGRVTVTPRTALPD